MTNGQRSVCNDDKLELKASVRNDANVRNDNKLKYVRNDTKLQPLGTKTREPRQSRQIDGMSVMTIN